MTPHNLVPLVIALLHDDLAHQTKELPIAN
jgi:hypothetical protein